MSDAKPWGQMDPNSAHQLWSEWVFTVYEGGRHVPYPDVHRNVFVWLRQGFGSVGQAKVEEKILSVRINEKLVAQRTFVITVHVEGAPAHDPAYVESVRKQFQGNFVSRGWGATAASQVKTRILAGDEQDGKPHKQLVVIPPLQILTEKV